MLLLQKVLVQILDAAKHCGTCALKHRACCFVEVTKSVHPDHKIIGQEKRGGEQH